MDSSGFGLAPEIEVGMNTVFVGVQVVHEDERNSLGCMPQSLRAARVICEDDIEENGCEPHRIEANFKIYPRYVRDKHRRGLPDLLPELGRIRE